MKKLKTLVLLGAVGAVVASIAKKLQAGRSTASAWQSADPVTAPRPAPTDASTPEPAPLDVMAGDDETLVDNAPAPAELPEEPVTPEAAGPQSTGPQPTGSDPLTDPLPDVTGEDEPRP